MLRGFAYWFSLLTCYGFVYTLFLHNSVLVDCMFLHGFLYSIGIVNRICPFPLDCPIYWCITVHSIFLCVFVFLWYQVQSLLLFQILFIWVLALLFLVNSDKDFKTLFYLFKEKSFRFIDLLFFLACILFVSALIFAVFFLSFTLNFVFVAFLALWGIN